jgi:hypothetical protein
MEVVSIHQRYSKLTWKTTASYINYITRYTQTKWHAKMSHLFSLWLCPNCPNWLQLTVTTLDQCCTLCHLHQEPPPHFHPPKHHTLWNLKKVQNWCNMSALFRVCGVHSDLYSWAPQTWWPWRTGSFSQLLRLPFMIYCPSHKTWYTSVHTQFNNNSVGRGHQTEGENRLDYNILKFKWSSHSITDNDDIKPSHTHNCQHQMTYCHQHQHSWCTLTTCPSPNTSSLKGLGPHYIRIHSVTTRLVVVGSWKG